MPLFRKPETIRKDYLLRKVRRLRKPAGKLVYMEDIGWDKAINKVIDIIEKSSR